MVGTSMMLKIFGFIGFGFAVPYTVFYHLYIKKTEKRKENSKRLERIENKAKNTKL